MRNATLEKLVWVLIYGGLLTLSLGAFVRRQSSWGDGLVVAGGLAALIGLVLIFVRARRRGSD